MNQEKAKQVLRKIKALSKEQPHFAINEIRVIVALERAIARLTHGFEYFRHGSVPRASPKQGRSLNRRTEEAL